VAQHAAMACFEDASLQEYERRRRQFRERRDYLVPALRTLGLDVPVMPDGAFYVWADCRQAAARLGLSDSWAFAHAVMEQAHVAITPGRDFGHAQTAGFVRLSSASALGELQAAVGRLERLLR
jgi:aspartate/methionine/tyrosine aminotransferase